MSENTTLTSRSYAVDDTMAAQELFHSRGWTDGLPVVPPTADAVQACLDWVLMPAGQLIGVEPVRERAITAEKLAVNAVMAGCLPMHFPVVVTAMTAMLEAPFLLHGATASTGGAAILTIINGPIRQELAMSGTFNALAASDRATTCIGRAIRLAVCNLLDIRPGGTDRSTLGHPGKLSYCLAEDEEHSSWLPLAEERGVFRVLALSGGGSRGAYGAGVLDGWTAAGTRPDFEVVSGISTGALMATFVFLGPAYDDRLRIYTRITNNDIYATRNPLAALTSDALRALIASQVDDEVLEAVARAHVEEGRRLLVGTTNLDANAMRLLRSERQRTVHGGENTTNEIERGFDPRRAAQGASCVIGASATDRAFQHEVCLTVHAHIHPEGRDST